MASTIVAGLVCPHCGKPELTASSDKWGIDMGHCEACGYGYEAFYDASTKPATLVDVTYDHPEWPTRKLV